MPPDISDEVSFLKFKVSELEKAIGNLETDMETLRAQFASYNSDAKYLKAQLPLMAAKYDEAISRFDIRMKSITGKLDELLRLSKKAAENRRAAIPA